MWPFRSSRPLGDLILLLNDSPTSERKKAFQELVEHEAPEADDVILGALRVDHDAPPDQLLPLIELVGKRGIEEGVEILRPLLSNYDAQIKLAALRALVRIPTQASLDSILPLVVDEDQNIRREVRGAVMGIFRENASGALLRAIPEDQTTPYYFEIASLCEEMGIFEQLIENFAMPDEEVKKFEFNNMIRFHRPEFLPCMLQMAGVGGLSIQNKLRKALSDYSTEELLGPVSEALKKDPNKALLKILDEVLFSRTNAKEELLQLAARVPRKEIRLELVLKILRKLDTLLFMPILGLLGDSHAPIRQIAADSLCELIQKTFERLEEESEQNKPFLRDQMAKWHAEVLSMIQVEPSDTILVPLCRVVFSLAGNRYELLYPALPRLVSDSPGEVIKHLVSLSPESRSTFFKGALQVDRQMGSILIRAAIKLAHPDLLRTLLECIDLLNPEERETLRKYLVSKSPVLSTTDLLSDPSPKIRAAILSMLGDIPGDINQLIEDRTRDTSPEVREIAISLAVQKRHPRLAAILENTLADPSPKVVMKVIHSLRETVSAERFPILLAKVINHPADEVRSYALKEIAIITQARYLENYHRLPLQVRKLAGSAILKLDAGFVDHLIGELHSLDVDSRLRAAMIMENLQIGEKAHQALLSAMQDPSQKVRAAVVKTLGVLGNQTLLGHLIEFLNDPDERVRANTIEAIAGIGDQEAIRILIPFLNDANNRIRGNAVFAVWKIGNLNVVPVVQKMLVHKDPAMRATGLWVLGEMHLEELLGMVIPFMRDKNDMIRFNALRSVSKIKLEVLKPFLTQLRRDPSPEIKRLITDLSYKII